MVGLAALLAPIGPFVALSRFKFAFGGLGGSLGFADAAFTAQARCASAGWARWGRGGTR